MKFQIIITYVLLLVSSELLAKENPAKLAKSKKQTHIFAGLGYSTINSSQLDRINFGLRGVTLNAGVRQNLSEKIAVGLDYSVFGRNKGTYPENAGIRIQQYTLGLEYIEPLLRHLSLGVKAGANFNQFSANLDENAFKLNSYRENYGKSFGGSVFFPMGITKFECSLSHTTLHLTMPELGIDSKIGITSFKGSFGFIF